MFNTTTQREPGNPELINYYTKESHQFNFGDDNSLVVIVPCYNEYSRLPINDFVNFIKQNHYIRFCFVNDASTDATLELLNSLKQKFPNNVSVISLEKNAGKAEAIRYGVLYLKTQRPGYIAFLDADLSAPLSELLRLYYIMINENLQLVFGSRVAIYGSNIRRSASRHYLGRFFATLASIVLKIVVYDTQCGLKIFENDIAQQIFENPFISRWIFDIEIIMRLKLIYKQNYLGTIMKEVPLYNWLEKGDSKLKLKEMLRTPLLLLKIGYHYRQKNGTIQTTQIVTRDSFNSNEIIQC